MPISPTKLKTLKWTIDKGGISLKPIVLKATEEEMRKRVKHGDTTVALLTSEIRDNQYLNQMARIELTIKDFETLAERILTEEGYLNYKEENKEWQKIPTILAQPTETKPNKTTMPWWKRLFVQENHENTR